MRSYAFQKGKLHAFSARQRRGAKLVRNWKGLQRQGGARVSYSACHIDVREHTFVTV